MKNHREKLGIRLTAGKIGITINLRNLQNIMSRQYSMKRLVKIKVIVALLLGLATIGTVGTGSALASNDKWGYSFYY